MNVRKAIVLSTTLATLSVSNYLPAATAAPKANVRPHMDVAFCIDTTASMQPEIDNVKAKVRQLVAKLATGKPTPIIRVGLVAYRDRGDAYITKVFPFTEDIDKVARDVATLQAEGGGDGPESVNEGLHTAVHELAWDADKKTAKILFLIGDAGPHYYPNDFNWKDESKQAISAGIQINTIGCNGLQNYPAAEGVEVFQQIAKLTDGAYEPLAYKQVVRTAGGVTETRISSSAGTFRLKSDKSGAWREGVTALSTRGFLAKPAAPALEATMFASPMAAPAGFAGRAAGKAMMADYASAGGGMKGSENNLDAIMLQAAQKKAKQALKVDYK